MEFQAYPCLKQGSKVGRMRALSQAQNFLHKNDNMILPIGLLLAASGLVAYEHARQMDSDDKTVRNFLVMILLSMVPLVYLQRGLLKCTDPLDVISKSSAKVLILQASFMTLRLFSTLLFSFQTNYYMCRNTAGLVGACVLLVLFFDFRLTRSCFWQHRDAWCLAVGGFLCAVCTEVFSAYLSGTLRFAWYPGWHRTRLGMFIMVVGSDYIETLAFVPAMWMVWRSQNKAPAENPADLDKMDVTKTQMRALALFLFMIIFYTSEDIHGVLDLWRELPLAAVAHGAHFLLLLDFTLFIVVHLYDPDRFEKFVGRFKDWLADNCQV